MSRTLALMALSLGLFFCGTAAVNGEVVAIHVAPGTISMSSSGEWVTVNVEVPYSLVVKDTLTLNDLAVDWTKSDLQGDLVGKFAVDAVKAIVKPGSVTVTVEGELIDGTVFTGSQTIQVVAPPGPKK